MASDGECALPVILPPISHPIIDLKVVDPEAVGKHIKKERPISKKTTFYCVRFFPAGD